MLKNAAIISKSFYIDIYREKREISKARGGVFRDGRIGRLTEHAPVPLLRYKFYVIKIFFFFLLPKREEKKLLSVARLLLAIV